MESLFNAASIMSRHIDDDCRRQAVKFYNDVYMKMNEDQKNAYLLVCGFFSNAQRAYDYATKAHGYDMGLTDGQRIFQVGVEADAAISTFRKFQSMRGLDVDKTCEKIAEIDRWLAKNGSYSHMSRPVDSNGVEHAKTVLEIWNDMIRYAKTRNAFRESMAAKEKAEGERR